MAATLSVVCSVVAVAVADPNVVVLVMLVAVSVVAYNVNDVLDALVFVEVMLLLMYAVLVPVVL